MLRKSFEIITGIIMLAVGAGLVGIDPRWGLIAGLIWAALFVWVFQAKEETAPSTRIDPVMEMPKVSEPTVEVAPEVIALLREVENLYPLDHHMICVKSRFGEDYDTRTAKPIYQHQLLGSTKNHPVNPILFRTPSGLPFLLELVQIKDGVITNKETTVTGFTSYQNLVTYMMEHFGAQSLDALNGHRLTFGSS